MFTEWRCLSAFRVLKFCVVACWIASDLSFKISFVSCWSMWEWRWGNAFCVLNYVCSVQMLRKNEVRECVNCVLWGCSESLELVLNSAGQTVDTLQIFRTCSTVHLSRWSGAEGVHFLELNFCVACWIALHLELESAFVSCGSMLSWQRGSGFFLLNFV